MSKETLPTLDQLFTETCRLISLGGPSAALPGMRFSADTLRGGVEFIVRSHSELREFSGVPGWGDVLSQLSPWKEQLFEEVGGAEHLDFPGAWISAFGTTEDRYPVLGAVRQIICASVAHYLTKRIAHERPDLLDDWPTQFIPGVDF